MSPTEDDEASISLLPNKPTSLTTKKEQIRLNQLNLYTFNNAILPIFYFMFGLAMRLTYVASRQYLRRDLQLSPAVQGYILDVLTQVGVYFCFSIEPPEHSLSCYMYLSRTNFFSRFFFLFFYSF